MTSTEARAKVDKLLALAASGSGATSGEAATAARIAHQICAKYGVAPSPRAPAHTSGGMNRALSGRIMPGWKPSPSRTYRADQGWGWWQWAARPFGAREVGVSGISDAQARAMALAVLTAGAYLDGSDAEIIEGALNGLLTEYGKILLDGLYALKV